MRAIFIHISCLWCYCLATFHNEMSSVATSPCKESSYLLGDSCYGLLYHNEDWDEAFQRCQSTGGRMAVIRNETVFKFLYKLLQWEIHFDYWIGVSKMNGVWRYPDDRQVTINSLWAPGQPDNVGITSTGSCVALSVNHHLLWDDEPCDFKYLHVCQYSNETEDAPCDEMFNGSCYHLHNERLTFLDAEMKCEENGGFLASPTSLEEHEFITNLIRISRKKADISSITTDAIQRTPLWVTNSRSPWNRRDNAANLIPQRPEEFTRCLYISTRGLGINCRIVASPICEYPVIMERTGSESQEQDTEPSQSADSGSTTRSAEEVVSTNTNATIVPKK